MLEVQKGHRIGYYLQIEIPLAHQCRNTQTPPWRRLDFSSAHFLRSPKLEMPGANEIVDFFFSPKVALFIFTIFIVSYLIFLDEEGAFNEKFLHFGPGDSDKNTTTFLGIKLDTWPKTIMLYVVGFFSALLTTYYQTVMGQNLHSYIWNKAIDTIPFSKTWTYAIIIMEPFFYQVLQIIQFFTNLTLQLQFIIPQFIGSYIADVPFTIRMLGDKRFDQL